MGGGTWITPTQVRGDVFVTNGTPFFQSGSSTTVTNGGHVHVQLHRFLQRHVHLQHRAARRAFARTDPAFGLPGLQRREGDHAPELLTRGAWRSRSSRIPIASLHEMGAHHPESPERLRAVLAAIEASGLAPKPEGRRGARGHARAAPARARRRSTWTSSSSPRPRASLRLPRSRYLDEPEVALGRAARRRRGGARHRPGDGGRGDERLLRGAPAGPPRHAATGPWASASSTTWPSARRTRSRRTAWSASRCSTSTSTTATAPRTRSTKTRASCCAPPSSIPYYPYCGADSGNDHIINVPLPAMTGGAGLPRGGGEGTGCRRSSASSRSWCSSPRASMRTAKIRSPTSSSRTRTTAGSPRSSWRWPTAHAKGRVVSTLEGGYNTVALGALRGRAPGGAARAALGKSTGSPRRRPIRIRAAVLGRKIGGSAVRGASSDADRWFTVRSRRFLRTLLLAIGLVDVDPRISRASHDSHVALRDAEALRDELDERFVGTPLDRRRGQPDLERVAMQAGHLGALGAGLDVEDQQDRAVGRRGNARTPGSLVRRRVVLARTSG